jgi:hypothetical protein
MAVSHPASAAPPIRGHGSSVRTAACCAAIRWIACKALQCCNQHTCQWVFAFWARMSLSSCHSTGRALAYDFAADEWCVSFVCGVQSCATWWCAAGDVFLQCKPGSCAHACLMTVCTLHTAPYTTGATFWQRPTTALSVVQEASMVAEAVAAALQRRSIYLGSRRTCSSLFISQRRLTQQEAHAWQSRHCRRQQRHNVETVIQAVLPHSKCASPCRTTAVQPCVAHPAAVSQWPL